jgi:hypothetical protein
MLTRGIPALLSGFILIFILSLISSSEAPPGESGGSGFQLTATFTNMNPPRTSYEANGILTTLDGTYSTDPDIRTIQVIGSVTVGAADYFSISINGTAVLPIVGGEHQEPDSVTGTLTVDGIDYDMADFTFVF